MFTAALVCLEIFALVAMIDGLWFHLIKYQLFIRPESRYEHRLHTIHAVFFPFLVYLLFLRQVSGLFLWMTVALVATDFAVEMMDVVCERASRASIGGLSTPEYATHVVAITSRVAAFTLALASRPTAAWSFAHSAVHRAPISTLSDAICWIIAAGGIGMALLHIWLLRRPEQHQDPAAAMS
jgi:hypothetical protein